MAQDLHILIVAAGSGSRVGGNVPKQYRSHLGKPLLGWSAERFAQDKRVRSLTIVVGAGQEGEALAALGGIEAKLITGGATRRDSVRNGLEHLAAHGAQGVVFIHDAARPDVPDSVIEALMAALATAPGATPVLPVADSIIRAEDGVIVPRETLRRVQTPQAFDLQAILTAHRAWPEDRDASDDAQMLRASGGEVALVPGDERLKKITFAEDFMELSPLPPFRIGTGYDVHRLVRGEELWLGGILFDHDFGLAGHSDADVVLHAITDAILGAIGAGDIGSHFPPSDPQWRGARSDRFLAHAVALADAAHYMIGNIDCTVICEAPKIGPRRDAMREEVARIVGTDIARISIKATTTEGLGYTGRREAIAASASALLQRKDEP